METYTGKSVNGIPFDDNGNVVITSGTSGTSGNNGTSGTSGNNGTSGTSGVNGTSGTSGNNGTSGTSGNNGTSGTSGVNGTSGNNGTSGTSGNNGTSGVNGTSGNNGTSGTSGNDGTSGTSAISVNTAFQSVTYAPTISMAYDATQPNFQINVTGDLDLTITGTTNGDFGLVNLYFSGTEVATLNGLTTLIITGAGTMISCSFEHDINGLRWYSEVNPSLFALQDGTILYHLAIATDTGTVTSSGTSWTGTGTSITDNMVGAKLTVLGQTTIIDTVDSGAQTFTTVNAIPATDEAIEIRCIASKVFLDGSISSYDYLGNIAYNMEANRNIDINGIGLRPNSNVTINGSQLDVQSSVFLKSDGDVSSAFKSDRIVYTYSTLPTFDSSVRVYASISDGGTPVYMTAAAGGGSTQCSVYWNGTLWLYK